MNYSKIAQTALINDKPEWKFKKNILNFLFAKMFDRMLIYPQIWEDPEVDIEALQIRNTDDIVAIASGGCNLLNMLTEQPNSIRGLDLCRAHLALNSLKITALSKLENHDDFFDFFGFANHSKNLNTYEKFLKPDLSEDDRLFWESRVLFRKRISMFSRNFYSFGALGNFIGAAHFIARMSGVNLAEVLNAKTLEEQKMFYEENLKNFFSSTILKILLRSPLALFGLGIPPSQFRKLKGKNELHQVLQERVNRLCCNYDVSDNYFAWQAFGRKYDTEHRKAIPRYLEKRHFNILKKEVRKITLHQKTITQYLSGLPNNSLDCFVLLDAQDWMNSLQLNQLWYEIDRTSRQGGRVIFRTAGSDNLVKRNVGEFILSKWEYSIEKSNYFHKKDRSAIYGGFHLMEKTGT